MKLRMLKSRVQDVLKEFGGGAEARPVKRVVNQMLLESGLRNVEKDANAFYARLEDAGVSPALLARLLPALAGGARGGGDYHMCLVAYEKISGRRDDWQPPNVNLTNSAGGTSNNCFMNSTLHMINSVCALREAAQRGASSNPGITEMFRLVNEMNDPGRSDTRIDTSQLRLAMQRLFGTDSQNDASELMVHLIDLWPDGQRALESPQKEQMQCKGGAIDGRDPWEIREEQMEYQIKVEHMRNELDKMGKRTNNTNTFIPLDNLINSLITETEEVDQRDCAVTGKAIKGPKVLQSSPDALIVQVSRSENRLGNRKNRRRVKAPIELDLARYLRAGVPPAQYRIRSIVWHSGLNVRDGHYIVTVRSGDDWVVYDDLKRTNGPLQADMLDVSDDYVRFRRGGRRTSGRRRPGAAASAGTGDAPAETVPPVERKDMDGMAAPQERNRSRSLFYRYWRRSGNPEDEVRYCNLSCHRCRGVKKNGGRCSRSTCRTHDLCWQHQRAFFGTKTQVVPGANGQRGLFATRDIPANTEIHRFYGTVVTKPELLAMYSSDNSEAKMSDGFPYALSLQNGRVLTAACNRDAASHANSASEAQRSMGSNPTTESNAKFMPFFSKHLPSSEIRPHDIVQFEKKIRMGRRSKSVHAFAYVVNAVDGDDDVTFREISRRGLKRARNVTYDDWYFERGVQAINLVKGADVDLKTPEVEGVVFGHEQVRARNQLQFDHYDILIVSKRMIKAGEEILVDYGDDYFENQNYDYSSRRVTAREKRTDKFGCMRDEWCR